MLKSSEKDIYYTIESKERAEIKIKASRFIASVSHAKNRDEAMTFLESIRDEFYDSTHNCYAWRMGRDGLDFRAADDGEPSGSAGKPILFTIKKFDLSDIIVVVTRYYGGTKLGVGGLARAYSEASEKALSLCSRKPVHITNTVKIFCTYQDISVIKRLVSEYAISFEENYHDSIEITANILESQVEYFCSEIFSKTNSRAGTILITN